MIANLRNLLLDTTSLIKITDLSLSKDNVTGLFSLATNKSLHYLSPELCREELYSDNTDVWSFGCIVYELLTLTHTFTGSNSFEIIKTILNDEPELAVSNSTETFEFILKNSIVKDKKTRMTSFQMLKSLVTNVKISIFKLFSFKYKQYKLICICQGRRGKVHMSPDIKRSQVERLFTKIFAKR
jgi:NIMA (never in mitosis gene a)-related kinase